MEISKISAKDTEKLIMSKEYGGGKQFGIDNVDNVWGFYESTHYAFKYKGDILAIIGVKNFYDLLKEQKGFYEIASLTLYIIPLLVLNDVSSENISLKDIFNALKYKGKFGEKLDDETDKKMYDLIKKSLYVCELQINKETIKKHDLSIIAPLMIVFDWVKKYSNDNYILCSGKDERTANMYKKVGKFWNITLNDKYSKKINEYVKEWGEKYYNSEPDKNIHTIGEIVLQYFEESIKLVCILKK